MAISFQSDWDSRMLERDYHIIRFLSQIPSWDNRLCLKGSVALTKIYSNNFRLCKDIDFCLADKPLVGRRQRLELLEELIIKVKPLLQRLALTGQCRILANARLLRIEIAYASFITSSQESFRVEIILRSNPLRFPQVQEIRHFYEDIGSFKLPVISMEDIVVEKLTAVLNKDRKFSAHLKDVYDLWHISQGGFNFEEESFTKLFKNYLIIDGNKTSRRSWCPNIVDNSQFAQQIGKFLRPFIKQNEVFDYQLAVLTLKKRFSNPVFGLTISQYIQMGINRYRRIIEDLLGL